MLLLFLLFVFIYHCFRYHLSHELLIAWLEHFQVTLEVKDLNSCEMFGLAEVDAVVEEHLVIVDQEIEEVREGLLRSQL
jgi:hypothetical protein